jgi:hypothetical protein
VLSLGGVVAGPESVTAAAGDTYPVALAKSAASPAHDGGANEYDSDNDQEEAHVQSFCKSRRLKTALPDAALSFKPGHFLERNGHSES